MKFHYPLVLSLDFRRLSAVLLASFGIASIAGAETWTLSSESLHFELDGKTHAYSVTDLRSGIKWDAPAFNKRYKLLRVEDLPGETLRTEFRDRKSKEIYFSTITLHQDRLEFTLDAKDKESPLTEIFYPAIPETDWEEGHILFANRSSGSLLPLETNDYPEKRLVSYANTGALDIPLFGILDKPDGKGLLLIIETPTEATINILPNPQGVIEPELLWFGSFNKFSYQRKVSLHFFHEGGYNAMAHRYRDWEEGEGNTKTLEEKARPIPRVNWLKGAAIVWGNIGESIIDEAPVHGIRRMMLNGRFTREAMLKAREQEYLLGEYDNYSDITPGKLGSSKDNIEEAGLVGPDGKVVLGWKTKEGIQYYNRSSKFARRAAEAVIPGILAEHPYTARFLDVHSAIQFFESYHPDHPMSRQEDMLYRQELYAYLSELGLVSGGEAAKGWVVPYIDFTEGPTSGAFYWYSDTGHLIRLNSREELPPEYLKFGMDPTLRVPLWDLVYHDQVASTWYWGDSNGYFYDIAPELSDLKDTLNLLHGTMPIVWLDHLGYGWDRERDRMLQTIHTTTRFHERVAFDALVRHDFMSEDRLLQESEFSSGAVVQVNFDEKPRDMVTPCGKTVTLPQNGYFITMDGLQQSKRWVDEAIEIHVQTEDFLYVKTDSDEPRTIGPVRISGEIAVYAMPSGEWNLRYKSNREVEVDLQALGIVKGFNPYRIVHVQDDGQHWKAFPTDGKAKIKLPPSSSSTLLSILPGIAPETPVILPDSGEVRTDTPVMIYTQSQDLEIRYTQDGTEPNAESTLFKGPFTLDQGTHLKAASFRKGKRIGKVREARLSVEVPLYRSPIMRGKDLPDKIRIPLKGLSELHIQITDAQDGPHWDQAVMGDAHFETVSGEKISLSVYPPKTSIRFNLENNTRQYEGEPLRIAGKSFEDGISSHSVDRIVYTLEDNFAWFYAEAGIHDRTGKDSPPDAKNGSVQFILTGISTPE